MARVANVYCRCGRHVGLDKGGLLMEVRLLRGHALRCGSWHHTYRWEGFDPLGSKADTRRRNMSVEENKALVRREQAELWNHTGNLDAAAELFAPDRVEDAKQEAANVLLAFPDLESTIEDLIAERDKVVAHCKAQANHRGEYMGITPTGNRVDFTGISIYRIEGGQIAESWGVSDELGLMRQIGAIPEPGQEAGG